MTILRVLRPFNAISSKQFTNVWKTSKPKFFSQHAPVAATNEIEEFMAKNEVSISGKNIEKLRPIFNFDETKFPDSVVGALKTKFDTPSMIQSASWPAVLDGRDLVGIARTGSGKTLAFLLPALVHISRQEPLKRGDGPMVLVLCPTRELAQQVEAVANEWSAIVTRVRTMCAFGGASKIPQEDKLARGVEIVVATPGRLNDFLRVQVTNLRRCSYLVLDEADRMLDMGFEPQIREIISRMENQRQTLMYSATWPSEIRNLAADFMRDFVHIKIGSGELSANKNITQVVHVTSRAQRDAKFWDLIKSLSADQSKILVFCPQKVVADRMEYLAQNKGIPASSIHGDKSQAQRDFVLRNFRTGKTKMLFATDVAARGLDVDNIQYVVNYEHPSCAEDYVHRIGRTARRDLKGQSHTFLVEDDAGERARDLIKVLRASGQEVSEELQKLAESSGGVGKATIRRWGSAGSFSPYGSNSRDRFKRDRFSSNFDHDRNWNNRGDGRYGMRNSGRFENRYSDYERRSVGRNDDDGDFDDFDVVGKGRRA